MAGARAFRLFEVTLYNFLNPEETELKDFLSKSNDFKKMKEIARTAISSPQTNGVPDQPEEQQIVKEIEKATKFCHLLETTSKIAAVPSWGKTLIYFGSFVNNKAAFDQYALQLRSEAAKIIAEKSYAEFDLDDPELRPV